MKNQKVLVGLVAAFLVLPVFAQAQIGVRARVVTESYSFDSGLALADVTETTIPIGINVGLGSFGALAISAGFVTVDVSGSGITDQTISSPLDTEFRFTFNLVPGKLMLLFNGALPTGTKTVELEELSVLGAISSDVIGFSAATVGTGGSLGGGFAGAIPLGTNFAAGVGATFKKALSYQPVAGRPGDLLPGAEFRVRFGLQGSLARRTYVRLAAIYASRGRDDFANLTRSGVGDRIIGYGSVNQAFGGSSVTLYSFVVNRGDPKLSSDPNVPSLPQGRLTAFGTRLDLRLGGSLVVAPRLEIRNSKEKINSSLRTIGSSTRVGTDITVPLGRSADLVFQGSFVSGEVAQSGSDIGFDGTRFGFYLDWHPR
jgi:hypothetical protein